MRIKPDFYFIAALLFVSLTFLTAWILPRHIAVLMEVEDGSIESLTAIFFLAAAIFFFMKFYKSRKGNDFILFRTRKNLFFLLLGLVFFFACGEEISWGQRLFHLKVPENIKKVNVQGEINFHNLEAFSSVDIQGRSKPGLLRFLSIKGLFFLFWLTYCVVFSAVYRFWKFGAYWIQRINLPVIPVRLGVLFLGNWIVYRILRNLAEGDVKFTHTMNEIVECNFAFLFFLAALYFILEQPERGEHAAN